MSEKACEWIEFDIEAFKKTTQTYQEDKEKSMQMSLKLRSVREAFTNERYTFNDSKEKALEAFTWRMSKENEMYRKIMLQKYISPQEMVMNLQGLELHKMSDEMVVKFGFDFDNLATAVSKFNLQEDKKYTTLQAISMKQKESDEKKFVDACMPSEEMKKEYL